MVRTVMSFTWEVPSIMLLSSGGCMDYIMVYLGVPWNRKGQEFITMLYIETNGSNEIDLPKDACRTPLPARNDLNLVHYPGLGKAWVSHEILDYDDRLVHARTEFQLMATMTT
ncbi:hypothetical protein OCU04_004183 [Sclerotinia nivalis]|uniref:Uncharacterized protein n=1 Tax=Sclerotinia nivalis TaxID=352851 RepID=A0A9X0DKC9_9HELO|nr:hypothetical protein OCU04_004183 [Sclerotinia nivalis]